MSELNGSWNIYKIVHAENGLVADAFALEIETDGTWAMPVLVTLEGLKQYIPAKAAEILRKHIAEQPEPADVLYGDDIDTAIVYGWSLEFSVLRALRADGGEVVAPA